MRAAVFLMILTLPAVPSPAAGSWEIGGALGYGMYHNGSIFSPNGRAEAGIRNRFALGLALGEDMYERLGGEIRYTYQDGDAFITAGGRRADIQGHSHTVVYNLIFYFHDSARRVRPYIAAGGGAKQYAANSAPSGLATLSNIGSLVERGQTLPAFSVGAGVKWRLGRSAVLRADLLDFITAFPGRIIVPAADGGARGLFHQFTPLLGIGYVF